MSSLESFATIEELEKVCGAVSDDDSRDKAEALLDQASNFLRQIAKNNHINLDEKIYDDDTGLYRENVKAVVITAAWRLLSSPTDSVAPDVTQWSQSASPYSESMSFGSGGAQTSIYFKTRELELLGLKSVSGKSQIGLLRGVR